MRQDVVQEVLMWLSWVKTMAGRHIYTLSVTGTIAGMRRLHAELMLCHGTWKE